MMGRREGAETRIGSEQDREWRMHEAGRRYNKRGRKCAVRCIVQHPYRLRSTKFPTKLVTSPAITKSEFVIGTS